ncbi:hypothetical protein D8770_09245 [Methylobacterium sp. DB1607]|nr:hypothetical protein [Methylobacterium sp. DB1607]
MGRRQDPGGAARETQGETARGEATGAGMVKVRTAKAGFSDLVLVCRKCAKRQGVDRKRIGRAVKRALKQAARDTGSAKPASKVRLLETGCLGPCPKRMLMLATPDSLARRRVILVDPALDTLAAEALVLAPLSPQAASTAPAAASPDDGAGNG